MSEFTYRLLISIAIVVITDLLLYFGLRRIFRKSGLNGSPGKKYKWTFISISLAFALYAIVYFLYLQRYGVSSEVYNKYFYITGAFILIYASKLVMLVFIIFENALLFLLQFLSFIFQNKSHYDLVRKTRRLKFFTWLGFVAGLAAFGYILYGMLVTRTDYRLREVNISYKNLPPAFDKLRIVNIADLHLGSFNNPEEVSPAFDLIREAKPDILLFSGDMVNVSAAEMLPYRKQLSELEAPLGKYAILGNHDQDDYLKFGPDPGREKMEAEVCAMERACGFTMLRNKHVMIHKGQDSIAIAGVDSWGLKPFRCYGKLDEALKGIGKNTFTVLMSHIPTHWDIEVKSKTPVELTLSGHTHAAQMGYENGDYHWSPIVWKYPEYMGLYKSGEQYLYVNAGLGYLGFPGRIGIRPEITVIILHRGDAPAVVGDYQGNASN